MAPRPRVLLIAEAANPEWVSVPLVGWSHAQSLRAVADVHLVTQIRNRGAISRAGLVEGRDFTAIDSEALAKPMWQAGRALGMGEGKGWTMVQALSALAYPWFERLVWRRFGADLRGGRFDLVHRITPLSPTIASPIARKCRRHGVPFVLGPLNGGVPWPRGFDQARREEREWLARLRGVYKALPGRHATLRAASAILAGSHHTLSEIPRAHRARCLYLPENAVDPSRFDRRAQHAPGGPLRACFIGRLVPVKGLDLLIEAAAPMLRDGRLRLDIIGDGQLALPLKAQVASQGAAQAVTFHGWVPHERVQDIAAQSAVLAFPSIKDFGGGVVLEAMALGLAPLVLDYAGPAELVTAGTGIKVPMGDRAEIVAGLRAALDRMDADRNAVSEMGARARIRAHTLFTWPQKARQTAAIYDWVLGRAEKPAFDFEAPSVICDDMPTDCPPRPDLSQETGS